jgi:mono/diheme cytochrome c family protein
VTIRSEATTDIALTFERETTHHCDGTRQQFIPAWHPFTESPVFRQREQLTCSKQCDTTSWNRVSQLRQSRVDPVTLRIEAAMQLFVSLTHRRTLTPAAQLAIVMLATLTCRGAGAADDAGFEFFEKRIRPILTEHCAECHSADAKKLGGNLLLDSRDGVRKGGDSGTIIEAGKPDASLLIKAVRYTDDNVKMPPKGKLSATAIADLEEWVRLGAPDPRDKPTARKPASSWDEILRTRRDWWSLRPVQDPPIPRTNDVAWSNEPIDRFVLAKLEENGLAPSRPTDPRTFARRLSLVLTGLPPSVSQVEQFAKDCEAVPKTANQALPAAAVERLVDSLLDSPHFGERWARHWMDVVRFTETHGNEWNYEVHHAWRYRDYLIRAFNADIPFEQFIREHIAGDLLPQPRWNEREQFNESIIGTGFYRFGEVNHDDCIGLRQIGYDLLDNQIDTLTKAFQATTVACARCHDHKLDAVSMPDYYGLLGILRSSRLVSHTIDAPSVNAEPIEKLIDLKLKLRAEVARLWLDELPKLNEFLAASLAGHGGRPADAELVTRVDRERVAKWTAILQEQPFPLEDPFEPWRVMATMPLVDNARIAIEWQSFANRYATEERARAEFNQSSFETHTDFRTCHDSGWQTEGQCLRGSIKSGWIVPNSEGDTLLKAILPSGLYTHFASEKLNGAIRSLVLKGGKKRLSFQVTGQRSSAVRLVSNNCQLNYVNYRALTSPDFTWVTFSPPENREELRVYAELMTMFDNPKFPDQLSALGGDPANYKLPFETAAENPRSYFGITRAVWHDGGETPRPELSHMQRLFAPGDISSLTDIADRYVAVIRSAIQSWTDGSATDDDVIWLNALLKRGLLSNSNTMSPRIAELVADYRRTENELARPRVVPGVGDFGTGYNQPMFVRGDCFCPAETVSRRYLEVLSRPNESFGNEGSGRRELAEQIASSTNPLTARVIVNRVWHHLFGTGIVRTVDDFGHVGDTPSHPELLDHLATQFVRDGWSIKKLIRSIVVTRTFQQSADQSSAHAREVDPQNRWLWHYPARRMEAEAIRDAMLATSGRLDPALFGPSIQPFREKENADRRLFPGPLDGNGRRSVYIKNNLMEAPRFLSAFNLPGGKVTQGRRDSTNVPAQALALLNDPFVLQQADVWAARLVHSSNESVESRIDAMFAVALGRPPSNDERQRFAQAVAQFAELEQVPPADVLKSQPIWRDVAHAVFNLKEFIFIP